MLVAQTLTGVRKDGLKDFEKKRRTEGGRDIKIGDWLNNTA